MRNFFSRPRERHDRGCGDGPVCERNTFNITRADFGQEVVGGLCSIRAQYTTRTRASRTYSQWNSDCLGKFFPMSIDESIVAAINIHQMIGCSPRSSAGFEIIFCLFRT